MLHVILICSKRLAAHAKRQAIFPSGVLLYRASFTAKGQPFFGLGFTDGAPCPGLGPNLTDGAIRRAALRADVPHIRVAAPGIIRRVFMAIMSGMTRGTAIVLGGAGQKTAGAADANTAV